MIRFGLAAIKGIGEIAVQSILNARPEGAKFRSLADLCERVDGRTVNRKALEALVKSGACDAFGETRAALFGQIDSAMARAASIVQDRQRGQGSLFGLLEEKHGSDWEPVEKLPEWPQSELLAAEKELLGFYVTGHPLTPYASILEKYSLASASTVGQLANRSLTRIGGLLTSVQPGIAKKTSKPYALATLEDLTGSVQLLCMNESYEKYRELLVAAKAVLVIGEVNTGDEKVKIFPQELMPLEEAPRRFTQQVHLRLNTAHLSAKDLESIRALAAAHPGKCPLFLCFRRPTGEILFVETHENFWVTPSQALQKGADDLFGEETYYAKIDTSLPERASRRWARRAEAPA